MYSNYQASMIILCLFLLIFNVFYLIFAFTVPSKTSSSFCMAVGILLHYFLLCSFFWMLAISILFYLSFHAVFVKIQNFAFYCLISALGMKRCLKFPFICNFFVHYLRYSFHNYNDKHFCWNWTQKVYIH